MSNRELRKGQKIWLIQIQKYMGKKPVFLEELFWKHEKQVFLTFRNRGIEFSVYVFLENGEINTETYPTEFLNGPELDRFIDKLLHFPFEEMFEEMHFFFANYNNSPEETNGSQSIYHPAPNFNRGPSSSYQPYVPFPRHRPNVIDNNLGVEDEHGTPDTNWLDIDKRDIDFRDVDSREGIDQYLHDIDQQVQQENYDHDYNYEYDDRD